MKKAYIAALVAALAIPAFQIQAAKPIKRAKKPKVEEVPVTETRVPFGSDATHAAVGTSAEVQALMNEPMRIDLTAADALQGEWTISKIQQETIEGEERPYIFFDLKEKRYYGDNGCNLMNGDIVLGKNQSLKFTNSITTQRFCPDAKYDSSIRAAMTTVKSYRVYAVGHEIYADLYASTKLPVMVLRRHNMEFLTGIWDVESVNGTPNTDPSVELAIDIDAKIVHGNTGCNVVNGKLFIDPDKTNSLQFTQMATTFRYCPDAEIERELLVALEQVESAIAKGDGRVSLLDTEGQELIVLRKSAKTNK